MCGRETFRMERIVKLFVRFRPLCLRYLQPTTTRLQMSKFWRCFQNTDSQPFEFYRHEFDAGNRPERAQTVLKKGHSCDTTVALLAFNCGSFANSKRRNGKTDGLLRWFKTGFPLWLENFGGCGFVHIIRHHQNQETHPDPPCREGAKDKGCLRKDKTIRIASTFFY